MNSGHEAKLRELGISLVYLFGSRAVGTSTPMSDTDIGVVLKEPSALKDTRVLYKALYDLFADQFPSAEIDIVFLQSAPLPLQLHASREGKILFETDAAVAPDYEARVTSMYLDFKPILEYLDESASERYAHV